MKLNIGITLWFHSMVSLSCTRLYEAQSQMFLKTSAQNKTRCVYLHGCVVMITRFPAAGRWPISALQKWCRENLAQSGSHATADWTPCTPHKWESLILHVGRVFHMLYRCRPSSGTQRYPSLTQPSQPHFSFSLVLFFLSLSSCLFFVSVCTPPVMFEDSVCWAHLISRR